MRSLLLAVPAVLLFTGARPATADPATAGQDKPTVAGAWALNAGKSDNARDKMAAAMRNRGRQGGSMVGGGGRMGGRGGAGGGMGGRGGRGGQGGGAMDPPPEGGSQPPAGGAAMLQGPRHLRIEFRESTVVLHRDEGEPLELTTDGKALVLGPEDRPVEYKAKWNGKKLELETRTKDGPRLVETYELDSGDPSLMNVDVRFTLPGPDGNLNVRLKRVYDRG